jgi:hypothetical protein
MVPESEVLFSGIPHLLFRLARPDPHAAA